MLLKNPIKEEHIWAQGTQIIAEGPNVVEYLLVYDGGKAFGKSHDMFGFNYYAEIDEIGPTKLGIIANIDFNDQITIYKNNLNIDYEAKKDLAFPKPITPIIAPITAPVATLLNMIKIPIMILDIPNGTFVKLPPKTGGTSKATGHNTRWVSPNRNPYIAPIKNNGLNGFVVFKSTTVIQIIGGIKANKELINVPSCNQLKS